MSRAVHSRARPELAEWGVLLSLGAVLLLASCARTNSAGPALSSPNGRVAEKAAEENPLPAGESWPDAPRLKAFRLLETIQRGASTEYVLTNAGWLVKMEIIPGLDSESAKALLDESILSVEALYANALSPYPGDISKVVVSDRRYRPQLNRSSVQGQERAYYLLHATARFGYGASTADALRYRSLLGWFFCPSGGWFYKVRCFAPRTVAPEDLEGFFNSLACPVLAPLGR
jgi:hypothetical protein